MADDAPLSPALAAMREAIAQAEAASAARQARKAAEGGEEEDGEGPEAEAALLVPFAEAEEDDDWRHWARVAAEAIPEEETADDSEEAVWVPPPEAAPEPWYTARAKAALPAAARDVPGGDTLHGLLTAVLVELGDVKRTNAMILERLAVIEERVERNNRLLADRRTKL